MQTQRQTLDVHTPSALTIATGSEPPLRGGRAIEVGGKAGTCFRAGKVGLMLLAILLIACGASAQTQSKPTQRYQVSYLDSLGGTNGRGNSINNRGWIAGYSLVTGNQNRHATLWRDGSLLDLGTLGSPDKNSSVTWPVKNERGIILGISQTDTPEPFGEGWSCGAFFSGPRKTGYTCLGFAWKDGFMRPLPPLPGGNNSFATGANDKGEMIGWAENGVHDSTCVGTQVLQFRPVVWGERTGQPHELPLISGDTSGAATAINHKGQVVGISGACDQAVGRRTAKHAVLWDKDQVIDIGDLGVDLWNTPMAINQRGDIVGFAGTDAADLDGNLLQAFIWTRREGINPLDRLPGHVFNQANGINEQGQVVGISCPADFDCRAFLWENNVMKNLNDLTAPGFTGVLLSAQDINDQGEITGRAFDPTTGQLRAFVAVPVQGHENQSDKAAASTPTRANVVVPGRVKQALRQQRGLINPGLLR